VDNVITSTKEDM